MIRFLMMTPVIPLLTDRKIAASRSDDVHPVPSRIAPYSPIKLSPVFGWISLVTVKSPALRQNVVPLGLAFTAAWILLVPGKMLIEPAGQVIVGWGPRA